MRALKRKDFQKLARMRLREAKTLFDADCLHGAYYLAGYAIECAIKSCIAKKVQRHDFPDKDAVLRAWTHDLTKLLRLAGLQGEIESDPELGVRWAGVKDWT